MRCSSLAALVVVLAGCDGHLSQLSREESARCEDEAAAHTPMRRLTAIEHTNSLRDLFPYAEISRPALSDPRSRVGLDNEAQRLLVDQNTQDAFGLAARRTAVAVASAIEGDAALREEIFGCELEGAEADRCEAQIVSRLGERVFRRPLEAEEQERWVSLFHEVRAEDPRDVGVPTEVLIEGLLLSPQFLYRIDDGVDLGAQTTELTPYELATRLSYFLWRSTPDAQLLEAARADALRTDDEIEVEVRRMLEDPRAERMVVGVIEQWLSLDRVRNETKASDLYPLWDDAMRDDVVEESERFVSHVLFEGSGSFVDVLLDRTAFVTPRLASLYDVTIPSGTREDGWVEVQLPATERRGVLTRAAFLAGHAHEGYGSPILRGARMVDRLLCREFSEIEPPMFENEEGREIVTNRDLFEAHTSNAACRTCHDQIDPLGFTFEGYDAIGAFRTIDNGEVVDAHGATPEGEPVEDAVELFDRIAESPAVLSCFGRTMYRFAHGRPPSAADTCELDAVQRVSRRTQGDVREVVVSVALTPSFRLRAL
ncbi:MAG: DUF1592 domain-containing protein [Deltaproteobacteria bacterium]|nr:DUF1592 domain-containing protein [Deltaproteobacteria bacterium]